MDYEYNLDKESSIIYTNMNLKKNDELMTFFLYKKFVKELFDLLVDLCDCGVFYTFSFLRYHFPRISHDILKENLSKYSYIVSSDTKKMDCKEFMFGYLDYINNNHCLDEIIDIGEFIQGYKDEVNNNINKYDIVNVVNKKTVSFSDKTNILVMFDDYLKNISNFIYELLDFEKAYEFIIDLKNTIINYIIDMDTENFFLGTFDSKLKDISFNFILEKIDCGELDLNKVCSGPFYDIYSYFDEYGKVVFKNLIPYIITNSEVNDANYVKIREKVNEELKLSKFKLNLEMNRFFRNYKKLRKTYFSEDEEKNIKKLKKVD